MGAATREADTHQPAFLGSHMTAAGTRRCFLPPHLADKLAGVGHPVEVEAALRTRRQQLAAVDQPLVTRTGKVALYTAAGRQVEPGTLLPDLSDPRAAEADRGLTATLDLLDSIGITTFDGGVVGTVHYGRAYDNAFWDGTQMVFGDGDGTLFGPFTAPIDVCAHELGHGVTGNLLDYQDQAGALNESMSDCQGVAVRQHALGLTQADPTAWLIGYGLLSPTVRGRALRDMLNPGTAYDDPKLGRDPQPATMAGYVHITQDNGGVHINSGIPNRAFALAALAIGDTTRTFAIWRTALGLLHKPAASFADFAAATVAAAGTLSVQVRGAWVTVGVLSASTPPVPPTPAPSPASSDPDDALLWSRVATWVGQRHSSSNKLAATAVAAWAKAKGLT